MQSQSVKRQRSCHDCGVFDDEIVLLKLTSPQGYQHSHMYACPKCAVTCSVCAAKTVRGYLREFESCTSPGCTAIKASNDAQARKRRNNRLNERLMLDPVTAERVRRGEIEDSSSTPSACDAERHKHAQRAQQKRNIAQKRKIEHIVEFFHGDTYIKDKHTQTTLDNWFSKALT